MPSPRPRGSYATTMTRRPDEGPRASIPSILAADWELVGGSVDPAANTVSADVQELRLFALAPPMPAGTLDVAASFEAGAAPPAPTTLASYTVAGLRRNDGTPVPDGTLYTVRVVSPGDPALVPVGEITSADASPAIPGVQRASQAGGIAFDAELPGAAGQVKVVVNSIEAPPSRAVTATV